MLVGVWVQFLTGALFIEMIFANTFPSNESEDENKENKYRFCGKKLTAVLQLVCENGYNVYPGSRMANINDEQTRRRVKRGIVDECCIKTCSQKTLQMYCSGPTLPPQDYIRSPHKRSNTSPDTLSNEMRISSLLEKFVEKNEHKSANNMKSNVNEISSENHIRHKAHGKSFHNKRDVKQDAEPEVATPSDQSDDLNSMAASKLRHATESKVLNQDVSKNSISSEKKRKGQPQAAGYIYPYFYNRSLLLPKLMSIKLL